MRNRLCFPYAGEGGNKSGMISQSKNEQLIKIAVVGDIHDQWEADDGIALQQMNVDLVLFVGDFGNESVEVVRMIAALDIPKAAVFGNHDAWYTATDWGRKKCPYNRKKKIGCSNNSIYWGKLMWVTAN